MLRGAFSLAAVSTFPITTCRTLTPLNFHPPAHSRTANAYPNIALPDCCALKFLREFWGTEYSRLRAAVTCPEQTVMIPLAGVRNYAPMNLYRESESEQMLVHQFHLNLHRLQHWVMD